MNCGIERVLRVLRGLLEGIGDGMRLTNIAARAGHFDCRLEEMLESSWLLQVVSRVFSGQKLLPVE